MGDCNFSCSYLIERHHIWLQYGRGVGAGCRTELLLYGGSFHPLQTQNHPAGSLEHTVVYTWTKEHPERCTQSIYTTLHRYRHRENVMAKTTKTDMAVGFLMQAFVQVPANWGALALVYAVKCQRRGRCTCALVRLHRTAFSGQQTLNFKNRDF